MNTYKFILRSLAFELHIMILHKHILCFILLLNFCNKICNAVSVEEDLTLTLKEKLALDEFKEVVDRYLPHDYMRGDMYLIRWLRARNLDVNAAKQMLLNSLRWREENRMDEILDEDFSRFELDYPITYDGIDRTGRPVIAADASQWDVRKAIVSGFKDTLVRYVYRLEEMIVRRVLDQQTRGLNVTQATVLLNMDGFNLIQHACVQCITVYVNFITASDNYFPGWSHKIVLINTPASFDVILRIIRPVMSPTTKEAFTVFGTNKQEWRRYLLNMISPDQLDKQFGGFRND